jgi:hypothetical protein
MSTIKYSNNISKSVVNHSISDNTSDDVSDDVADAVADDVADADSSDSGVVEDADDDSSDSGVVEDADDDSSDSGVVEDADDDSSDSGVVEDEDKPCKTHYDYFKYKPYVQEDEEYIIGYHYGVCLYCIMDGGEWDEEWDSWAEVTGRAMKIIYTGYCDGKNGINFINDCRDINLISINLQNNIIAFRNHYRLGQQLASKDIDCGNELWDMSCERAHDNTFYGPITTRDISSRKFITKYHKPRISCAPHEMLPTHIKSVNKK